MSRFKVNMAILLATSLGCLEAASPYPMGAPYREGYLQVSEKHQIYYAEYGNPDGIPVVILHGGPGVGSHPAYTSLFDLSRWHVVMFDQRGAMRSLPFASMDENTPQNSIADIEQLRRFLKIDQWMVFGNSWGSCLALLYGEAHPENCLGFILEGLFLGREEDIDFFREIFSQSAYEDFLSHFTAEEQTNIIYACYQRVMNPDPLVHMEIARVFMRYQLLNSKTPPSLEVVEQILSNDRQILSFIRALLHYSFNYCFLSPNQVISNLNRIIHLPAWIVHGSLDTVCLPKQAYLLHQNWPNSKLTIVEGSGHSFKEADNTKALVLVTDAFVQSMQND